MIIIIIIDDKNDNDDDNNKCPSIYSEFRGQAEGGGGQGEDFCNLGQLRRLISDSD